VFAVILVIAGLRKFDLTGGNSRRRIVAGGRRVSGFIASTAIASGGEK
jgi:hypothetical protein